MAGPGRRGGKNVGLKEIADRAAEQLDGLVETMLVYHRTNTEVPMQNGRDMDIWAEMEQQRPVCPAVDMDAEDPLFLLYTSGGVCLPAGPSQDRLHRQPQRDGAHHRRLPHLRIAHTQGSV